MNIAVLAWSRSRSRMQMRWLKNKIFFSLVTDAAVKSFGEVRK